MCGVTKWKAILSYLFEVIMILALILIVLALVAGLGWLASRDNVTW